jgi:Tfp pilus tip-associated adhesin PilY1
MKKLCSVFGIVICLLIFIGVSDAMAQMLSYCSNPPFVSTTLPPNVMIMLSIETPMQGAAHPDQTCTGTPLTTYSCNPSSCRTTSGGRAISNCYDNAVDYYGYFDTGKCYTYASNKFSPSGNATSHQCGGTAWSGNFLNWSTMMSVDTFRKIFTGGNRSTDTGGASPLTVLLGARQTLSVGNSWYPVKRINSSASQYIPSAALGGDTDVYIVRHANGFSLCSVSSCTVAETGSGESRFPTTSGTTNVLSAYRLQLDVCVTASGLESNCNTTTIKPEGLAQKYQNSMRFSLMAYSKNDAKEKDGAVLRANMKWLPATVPFGSSYHNASGTLVLCGTLAGCANPEGEINTDGTFVAYSTTPSNINQRATLINYLNKYAYANGYKSYDPISEMYYQIVRYFKNQGPSGNNYCTGLGGTVGITDDGYPAICSQDSTHQWRDPYIFPCQQSAIVAVNDANPWCDKRIPGTAFTTSAHVNNHNDCSTLGTGTQYRDVGNPTNYNGTADSVLDPVNNRGVADWTNILGTDEWGGSITLNVGCVRGGICDWANTSKTFTNLGEVAGTAPYPPKGNSYYIAGLAYYAHTTDLRQDLGGTQTISTYMIDTQESASSMLVGRPNMLYLAAKYGGFIDANGSNNPDLASEWDSNVDGFPDTYFFASNPTLVESSLVKAFDEILRRASSGTAASVLASGEGSGAALIQAIFYPKRMVGNREIEWSSTLQSYWYYIDPYLNSSSIREDTVHDNALVLDQDFITEYWFDPSDQRTKAHRWVSDGSGNKGAQQPDVFLENLQSIWEAGMSLWSTTPSSRTIWTNCINPTACNASTGLTLMPFDQANFNSATLRSYLQAASVDETAAIVRYIRGEDTPLSGLSAFTYRPRTTTISGVQNVWKLGDIINSTPKILSWIPTNNYHTVYSDGTYQSFINLPAYMRRGTVFTGANDGMLHAFKFGLLETVEDGTTTKAILCNDANNNGQCDTGETDATNRAMLGKEQWAFIPTNALPYLKYLAETNYCHMYYVDGTPFVFDVSIKRDDTAANDARCDATDTNAGVLDLSTAHNYWSCQKTVNSWRTILIGSMRLGGACKNTTYTGTYGVKTPVTDVGYSSYFALDVTDSANPILLWEFSDPTLGFSTSGPVVMKINDRVNATSSTSVSDNTRNGKWFVVFASGPTGPIDTSMHQFKAFSDQSLKLFVLDLKTGQLLRTIDTGDLSLPSDGTATISSSNIQIQNAFGGSLVGSQVDLDSDYQDDVVYLGYTRSEDATPSATTRWNQGGVIRVVTREDLNGINFQTSNPGDTALNPNNWVWSHVAANIGPVTSAIANLSHYMPGQNAPDQTYLFFGTGRYFYKTTEIDDANSQRTIFGIQEPCLTPMNNLLTSTTFCGTNNVDLIPTGFLVDDGNHTQITNVTNSSAGTNDPDGWYINLDTSSGNSLGERNITDPLAITAGAVFYTTFAPSSDICAFGGNSYIWAVEYDTGGSAVGLLQGKALLQVSTGAIEQKDVLASFTDKGNRRTVAITGVPPTGQGLSIVTGPPPVKRPLHMKEK